jgi:signal transduction histidine kinase
MNSLISSSQPILPSLAGAAGSRPATAPVGVPVAAPDGAPPVGAVRAVIADDTADVRLALRMMIQARSDIQIVAEASDGGEAVVAVREHRPDLLLLDLSMPVLDGIGVLQELGGAHPETKIVVLSGYGRDHVAAHALELGAVAYVEKGGATRSLLAMITELFPGRIGAAPRRTAPARPDPTPSTPATTVDGLPDAVAAAVHALRSPVAVLSDTASELIDGRDRMPSATVDDRLASLLRNVRSVARVVNALEDSYRAGSDGLGLIPQPVQLSHLVAAALPDLRKLVGTRTVELIVDDDGLVAADPLRVRQVIENLVSNAARFSAPSTPIEIIVSSDGATGEIAVVDHGSGIDEDRVPELFHRFARLDHPEAGVGLGLFVSQQIARAHGGDLVLADTGEEGSTFLLTLPAVQPAKRPRVSGS